MYSTVFSIKKKILTESGEIYAQMKHHLQAKTGENSSKQICGWILMWEENSRLHFSLQEILWWIMDL